MDAPKKKLGFGLMRLPLLNPEDGASVDLEQMKQMVDSFLAQGFTYFDTAWMYCGGKSEEFTNKALVSRHPRDSFTLTTKLPAYMIKKEEDREFVFQEQLRRTGAGYFDYYWLHDVNARSLRRFDRYNCWDFILQKKAEGLVRHVGFSYHDTPELLEQILTDHPEMEYVQLQLNYLDWDSLGVQSHACYDVATRHGKPVIVMEPVKGGTLAKIPPEAEELLNNLDPHMSIPSWAIRFAASLENVMMVLSGMSSVEQMRDNISFMKDFQPLTKEETEATRKVADLINGQIAVPCTGCSYCTEDCPMHIAIPKYFSLYNEDMREDMAHKGWTINFTNYDKLTEHFGRAADCIGCGQCESVCPQHLPIIEKLRDVSAHFDH